MNRRTLTIVVGILLTLSLIGVGFASWVITAGETENYSGAINVQKVNDERIYIDSVQFKKGSENVAQADVDFVLGAPVTPAVSATYNWLQNETKEVLTFDVVFTVKKKADNSLVKDANVEVAFNLAEGTSFAVADVDGKTYAVIVDETPEITNNNDGTYSFTIALEWGNYWEGVNPYDHYNSQPISDDLATAANTTLGKMYSALSTAKYNLVITANPAQ